MPAPPLMHVIADFAGEEIAAAVAVEDVVHTVPVTSSLRDGAVDGDAVVGVDQQLERQRVQVHIVRAVDDDVQAVGIAVPDKGEFLAGKKTVEGQRRRGEELEALDVQ